MDLQLLAVMIFSAIVFIVTNYTSYEKGRFDEMLKQARKEREELEQSLKHLDESNRELGRRIDFINEILTGIKEVKE